MSSFQFRLPIASITPFTFQDYPDHNAAILWFMGCNMRCSYCHNPDLVMGRYNVLPFAKIEEFLQSRLGFLDAIVLSGGECTLTKDIIHFARFIKSFGFKLKIDTNGCSPHVIEKLIKDGLVDFIALDYKGNREKFQKITNLDGYDLFLHSLKLLNSSSIEWEIRTTFHSSFLDKDDIKCMANLLEKEQIEKPLILQRVIQCNNLGNVNFPEMENFGSEEFEKKYHCNFRN